MGEAGNGLYYPDTPVEEDSFTPDPRERGDDMTETESPCDFHCGYYSSGRDLHEHTAWEHRDCTECGAKAPERPYSLTHRLDCPRLQPGYAYPLTGSGYEPYDDEDGEDMEGEHIQHHVRDPKGDEAAHA